MSVLIKPKIILQDVPKSETKETTIEKMLRLGEEIGV